MKALIVDDSLDSRMLLRKILAKAFDTQIIEAIHGKDALGKLLTEKPDVVFLDYEMPVMNGKDMLMTIRAMPEFRNLPIVMVTSHSKKRSCSGASLKQSSCLSLKPFSVDYVIKSISILFPKSQTGTVV